MKLNSCPTSFLLLTLHFLWKRSISSLTTPKASTIKGTFISSDLSPTNEKRLTMLGRARSKYLFIKASRVPAWRVLFM
ncbi:hypothetical protein BDB01DRAFT_795572, partial [Pilobolus umbonatus]